MLVSIVRDYWEGYGFFVRELPLREAASAKRSAMAVHWIEVSHAEATAGGGEPGLQWFSRDIRSCARAVLVVPDWLGGRSPLLSFGNGAKLSTYLQKTFLNALRLPTEAEAMGMPVVVLLPALPMGEPHRSKAMRALEEAGVEAVVSFRTILLDLCQQVESFPAAKGSSFGQCLQLLKAYDLLNVTQLELFNR